jgi:CRP-like cAMP-binding protein
VSSRPDNPLSKMVAKLQLWTMLSDVDRNAVLALPHTRRSLNAHQHVVWEGDRAQNTCLLLSGFAFRHKVVGNGGRQIFSLHLPGDVVDLQNSLLGQADHNVQMLTDGEIALIPVEAIQKLALNHPHVGMAMWYETLVEAAIFREWIANIGRRSAGARIAHLLCEFALRLEAGGLGNQLGFTLPMTQEQIADATSLTPVHVNRTLKVLEGDGLIGRDRRFVNIPDWRRLATAGDFDPRYLHLERIGVRAAGRSI